MPNAVVHFEITGRDGEKLHAYYSELRLFNDPEGHVVGLVKAGAA